MAVPIWAGRYIGLPFLDHGRGPAGLDCWGLVRLVYLEQFGIVLPSYVDEYERTTQVQKISALIDRVSRDWDAVGRAHEKCGDVIVMIVRGAPMHVGIVLGDGQMLHIEYGINSVIEKYTGSRWSGRIDGFYRHATSNAK